MINALRVALLCVLLSLCVGIAGCGYRSDATAMISDIKADETVVFFRTAAWQDPGNRSWYLPIHGWIYEPEESTVRLSALRETLESGFNLAVEKQHESNFSQRTNLLIADNERGKRIAIRIAGRSHLTSPSAENGHFGSTIVVSEADVRRYSNNGYLRFEAITGKGESRVFTGEIKIVQPTGLSVISDIDDTVKVSNVTDRRRLLEQTFLQDFIAAPGMADLYQSWSTEDVSFHYVSSSPWQLYSPLQEFLDKAGFPWATFSLKAVRFRDETLLDLFKKGTETKPQAIEAILDRYPERTFALIGDSGEQDPEVYSALLRKRPSQIAKVCIRNVTGERADNERFSAVFKDVAPDRWQLFEDPAALECF